MKKQALILVGSAMLAFTACNNEQPAESTGPTQAQLDSMNAAQADEAQQKATQDSLANVAAMEKAKADSLAGALNATKEDMAKKPVTTTKTVVDKKVKGDKTKTTTTTTTTSTNPKDARFNDKAADNAQKQSANEKADRFK